MALRPQTYTKGSLVDKHINTAYDTVRSVAENLEAVNIIADSTNLTAILQVATNIINVALVSADISNGKIDAAIAAAISTALDVITTGEDVTATNTNAAQTIADVILTAADVTTTNADAASTAADLVTVAAIFDSFDDTYLGAKVSDPILDNDGDPLVAGQVYWNTTDSEVRFYNGTIWEQPEAAASTSAAEALASEQAAGISETNSATSESNAATSAALAAAEALNIGNLPIAIDATAADATAITIDSSENIGIGVVPKSWSDGPALQLGNLGSLWSFPDQMNVISGAYYDSGWKYQDDKYASYYLQALGEHKFSVALAGTADTAITWTLALKIDNSANATFGGNVSLADNKSLYLGNSNDLQIEHNGSNTYLRNNTGSLFLRNQTPSQIIQIDTDNSAGVLKTGIIVGGVTPYVRLYHNGSERFATTATGISLSAATNPTIEFDSNDYFSFSKGGDTLSLVLNSVVSIAADTDAVAGNTRFMIYDVDNATLERVTVGAADSGGAGYKVLRIPN